MRLSLVLGLLTLACAPLSAQYFPPGIFDRMPQKDESIASRYGKFLHALHEPSLWELWQQKPEAEEYRFLWLRTLDHPIAVRIVVRQSGSGWIHSEMTGGKGGYEPGRIVHYNVSWLTGNRTQSFLRELESAGFWDLPTRQATDEIVLDGADWILEGMKNGQYHLIGRYAPNASDPVRQIGLLALKLGRFRHLHPSEIY